MINDNLYSAVDFSEMTLETVNLQFEIGGITGRISAATSEQKEMLKKDAETEILYVVDFNSVLYGYDDLKLATSHVFQRMPGREISISELTDMNTTMIGLLNAVTDLL